METHGTAELMEHHGSEKNKNRIALTISILAMTLAIASLGGSNAMKEATHENILAANAYSFYQAKSTRQTSLKIAATDLELQLIRDKDINPETRSIFQKTIQDYKNTIDRYESEPAKNEGKKELLEIAKKHEHARDHAMRQDPWFDYAEGTLQISIVLLSVSIIGSIPALFIAGTSLGLLGFLFTLNGFLLVF